MKKQMKRKVSLVERIKRFSKRKLFKNKIYSISLMLTGYVSMKLLGDGTFFLFTIMLGLPVFFARENVIQ
jgi:hypothetical protein